MAMPNSSFAVALRFLTVGSLVAVLATLAFVPVVSATDGAPRTLATEPYGRTLKLGDIASDDHLAVVFQDKNVSYVRWSNNEGKTFSSRVALQDGLPSKDPRVASCNDSIFAVSNLQTATGTEVGLYYRNFVTRDNGNIGVGVGDLADVACYGDVAAVTWVDNDHAWLSTFDCFDPCALIETLDLGTGDFSSPPRISGDYGGFTVAWLTTGLAIQHFEFGNEGTLTPGPVLTLMAGKGVTAPEISALGQRVVVAYVRAGRTHIRISDDVASSFGPRIVVSTACSNCSGAVWPDSISVRGATIVVEAIRPFGSPISYAMNSYVSLDSGGSWAKGASREGGFQRAVILENGGFAEVWDRHFYNAYPYPAAQQVIGFQVRDL
jgi:hypothetical protein